MLKDRMFALAKNILVLAVCSLPTLPLVAFEVLLVTGTITTTPVIGEERENPVSPRAIIQEKFTPKDMTAVYRNLNSDLRRKMSRPLRCTYIELESMCSFNSAAVDRILIDYRAVGWVIEKSYTSDSAGDVYVFKLPVKP